MDIPRMTVVTAFVPQSVIRMVGVNKMVLIAVWESHQHLDKGVKYRVE